MSDYSLSPVSTLTMLASDVLLNRLKSLLDKLILNGLSLPHLSLIKITKQH